MPSVKRKAYDQVPPRRDSSMTLKDMLKKIASMLYVKGRDLSDPFGDRQDPDAGQDGKPAIEAGIKIEF